MTRNQNARRSGTGEAVSAYLVRPSPSGSRASASSPVLQGLDRGPRRLPHRQPERADRLGDLGAERGGQAPRGELLGVLVEAVGETVVADRAQRLPRGGRLRSGDAGAVVPTGATQPPPFAPTSARSEARVMLTMRCLQTWKSPRTGGYRVRRGPRPVRRPGGRRFRRSPRHGGARCSRRGGSRAADRQPVRPMAIESPLDPRSSPVTQSCTARASALASALVAAYTLMSTISRASRRPSSPPPGICSIWIVGSSLRSRLSSSSRTTASGKRTVARVMSSSSMSTRAVTGSARRSGRHAAGRGGRGPSPCRTPPNGRSRRCSNRGHSAVPASTAARSAIRRP
jgi:hypothetical protein